MMPRKNIITRIHEEMNQFFTSTNIRPRYLYIGTTELDQLQLSEGLFCPPQHINDVTEESIFGMEPVFVKRENFLKVG